MKEEKLVCFRCRKGIEKGSHYYTFQEFNQGKFIREDYAHKECWDKFLDKVSDSREAMGVVRKLTKSLTKMGVLEPEEVVIT